MTVVLEWLDDMLSHEELRLLTWSRRGRLRRLSRLPSDSLLATNLRRSLEVIDRRIALLRGRIAEQYSNFYDAQGERHLHSARVTASP